MFLRNSFTTTHFIKTQEHLLWIFIKYRFQKRAVIPLTTINI